MTPLPGRTGVLGGTFDPVHEGHVAAAEAARRALALDRVLFIPSHRPPHRAAQPQASAFHRFAMVSLAVERHPAFLVSDVELERPGPSYTADTLRRLHEAGYEASQLFFILGTDAFAEIATWRDYPAVLDLAHFVVVARPGQALGLMKEQVPDLVARMRPTVEGARDEAEGPPCAVFLVNAGTPDVSSTQIRERAARGASLVGLVAPDVERHIGRHRLYQR
jgi:nicotinate-nucleotide adenylyltransferase